MLILKFLVANIIKDKRSFEALSNTEFKVLLGAHDLSNKNEKGRLFVDINEIHINNLWSTLSKSYNADIAVLILSQKVQFSAFIEPICLDFSITSINDGVVVGYGNSKEEMRLNGNIPKKYSTPIITNEMCNVKYPNLTKYSSSNTFCANACFNENGQGLVVKHNGFYFLRGLVSVAFRRGDYGCDANAYSIYTDVPKYLDWINEIEADESFDCN